MQHLQETTRRRFPLMAAFALSALASPARAAGPHDALPAAVSLGQELAAALRKGSPLVVLVSLDGCVFCRAVRESHLAPMARQGLPVVQVDWRSTSGLRDFAGAPATHDEMARRWGVKVAPTVLFFGPGGREVAGRLAGSYLPDFYGAYLEDRLEQGRRALRG